MKKSIFRKMWMLFVVMFMIIGNFQCGIYADDENTTESSQTISISFTEVQYASKTGDDSYTEFKDLRNDVELKTGDKLQGKIGFKVSNISQDNLTARMKLDLFNVTITNSGGGNLPDGAGTFEFTNDGYLVIKVNPEYLKTHSDVDGYVSFNGNLLFADSDLQHGNYTTIKLGNQTWNVIYSDGKASGKADSYKWLDGNVYKEVDQGGNTKYYQDFKVKLWKTNNNSTDVTFQKGSLQDTSGDKLTLDTVKGITLTFKDGSIQGPFDSFENIPDIVLSDTNSEVILSYREEISGTVHEILKNSQTWPYTGFNNQFSGAYTSDRDTEQGSVNSGTNTISIDKPSLSKSGEVSHDNNSITWTVTLNTKSYGKLLSQEELTNLITNIQDTATSGGFTAPTLNVSDAIITDDPQSGVVYTWTYTTDITNKETTSLGFTYVNTISMEVDGIPYQADGRVEMKPSYDKAIEKTVDSVDFEKNIINWNVDLTFFSGMSQVSLEDGPFTEWKDNKRTSKLDLAKNVWMEKDGQQIQILKDWDITEEGKSVIESVNKDDGQYRTYLRFKSTFVDSNLNKLIRFKLETVVNEWQPYYNYKNTAYLYYDTPNKEHKSAQSEASYLYAKTLQKEGSLAKDADGNELNKLNYTVKFNLKNISNLNENGKIILKEELTNGFHIVPESINGKVNIGGNWDLWNSNFKYGAENSPISFDTSTNTIVYTVPKEVIDTLKNNESCQNANAWFLQLDYEVIPDNIEEFYKNNKTVSVINTISGSYNDETILDTASTSNDIKPVSVINKTGTIANQYGYIENQATFTITINSEGIVLNENNPLTAVDEMNPNMSFDLESIQIINDADKQNEVTLVRNKDYTVEMDDTTNSLIFKNLPDATPLRITYKVDINLPIGTKLDEKNSWNKFSLFSNAGNKEDTKTAKLSGDFIPSAFIEGSNSELEIDKYTKVNNEEKMLQGAKFSVYKETYSQKDDTMIDGELYSINKNNEEITEFATGNNGKAFIQLKADQLYKLVETKAPEGYTKSDVVTYFIFKGNDFSKVKLPASNSKYKVEVFDKKVENLNTFIGEIKVENAAQTEATGALEIHKTTVNNTYTDGITTPDTTKFTITGPNNYKNEVYYKDFAETDLGYKKYTISGLKPGNYKVQELNSTIESKELIVKVSNGITEKIQKNDLEQEVLPGETPTIYDFENTYTDIKGKLNLKKTFSGKSIGQLSDEEKQNITFTIAKKNDASFKPLTIHLTDMDCKNGEYSKEISVPVGVYTIQEIRSVEDSNYEVEVTYSVGKKKYSESEWNKEDGVLVEKDKLSDVTINNSYSPSKGSLTINKTVSGEVAKEDLNKIEFKIYKFDDEEEKLDRTIGFSELKYDESTNSYSYTINDLPVGTYKIEEVNANIDGYTVATKYLINNEEKNIASVEKNNSVKVSITNTYDKKMYPISICKQDSVTKQFVEGANLSVKDANGNVIASWTTVENENKTITIAPGTYTLHEDSAPVGYMVANDIAFTVDAEGKITVNDETVDKVTMVDTKTSISVSKVDGNDGHALEGARFQILNGDEVVNEWDSTSEAYTVEGLATNVPYVLRETKAPEGYLLAQDIPFQISADGSVVSDALEEGKLVVKDTPISSTSYSVKKEWSDNGTTGVVFPESVHVKLMEKCNGIESVVEEADLNVDNGWSITWNDLATTDEAGTTIQYYAVEDEVAGYNSVNAISSDENGTYQTITNTYAEGKEVTISKEDVGGNTIGGANLSVKDANGNVIASWTTVENENKTITIAPGTYTLHEDSAPVGYMVASDIAFTVDENGIVTVDGKVVDSVVMVDTFAVHNVRIDKVNSVTGKNIAGAKLNIVDSDNKKVDEWTSDENTHVISLKSGKYTLVEEKAPNGYKVAEKISFEISDNGEILVDGRVVDSVVMKDIPDSKITDTSDHTNIPFFGVTGLMSLLFALAIMQYRKRNS